MEGALVVRVLADGSDPEKVKVGEICSRELTTVPATASIDAALARHPPRHASVTQTGPKQKILTQEPPSVIKIEGKDFLGWTTTFYVVSSSTRGARLSRPRSASSIAAGRPSSPGGRARRITCGRSRGNCRRTEP
jgi:hypothetical protein